MPGPRSGTNTPDGAVCTGPKLVHFVNVEEPSGLNRDWTENPKPERLLEAHVTVNWVAVVPVIGAIVTGTLIVPLIAVGSVAVEEYGYQPAAANSNSYTSPVPFGPESNRGARAGPSPMESLAVCELGPGRTTARRSQD